ncbi:MAG: hypothetical protein AAFX50_05905, partial [Acidobacteriota bacterium]
MRSIDRPPFLVCATASPAATARARLSRFGLVAALVALVAFWAVPAAAESTGDPVLDGVMELLEAELSEAVIMDWLATVEERPRVPTAGDLVTLRRAGASDALMKSVLAIARGESAPSRVPPAAPAVAAPSAAPESTDSAAAAPPADPADRVDEAPRPAARP